MGNALGIASIRRNRADGEAPEGLGPGVLEIVESGRRDRDPAKASIAEERPHQCRRCVRRTSMPLKPKPARRNRRSFAAALLNRHAFASVGTDRGDSGSKTLEANA